jgi:hypothetical protein
MEKSTEEILIINKNMKKPTPVNLRGANSNQIKFDLQKINTLKIIFNTLTINLNNHTPSDGKSH